VKIENLLHHSHFANRTRRHYYHYPYLKNIHTPFLPYLIMNPCFAVVKENFSIVLKKRKANKMLVVGRWRVDDGGGTAARINGGDEAIRSTAGALVLCS
jgi:hypothetical protein